MTGQLLSPLRPFRPTHERSRWRCEEPKPRQMSALSSHEISSLMLWPKEARRHARREIYLDAPPPPPPPLLRPVNAVGAPPWMRAGGPDPMRKGEPEWLLGISA